MWKMGAMLATALVQVPPAPVVDSARTGEQPRQLSARWQPGGVTCGGATVTPVERNSPHLSQSWGKSGPFATASYSFRIDASGRPLSIKREGIGFIESGDDLGPSLVTWRFAAGAAREGCRVTFAGSRTTVAAVPVPELMAATVLAPTTVPREAWLRVRSPGSDCVEPAPVPQLLAFPDFERLPEQTGERRWTMVAYDIDAGGKPIHIHTVGCTAATALTAAGVEAIGRSRYERKARTGCLYPYWQRSRPVPAPEPPTQPSMRPAGATCPDPLPYDKQPTLTFPQNFQRRNIEGWAVVAFDVAPWGATGNWRVLAAEPAAEFGDWALNVVRGATKPASTTGYVGCVDRVLFRIADKPALIVRDTALPPRPDLPPPSD